MHACVPTTQYRSTYHKLSALKVPCGTFPTFLHTDVSEVQYGRFVCDGTHKRVVKFTLYLYQNVQ